MCGALFTTFVDNFALLKIGSNCEAHSSVDLKARALDIVRGSADDDEIKCRRGLHTKMYNTHKPGA